MTYNYFIKIGKSYLKLQSPVEIEWSSDANAFLEKGITSDSNITEIFSLIPTEHIPSVGTTAIAATQIRRIYVEDGLEAREFINALDSSVYGLTAETGEKSCQLFLDIHYPSLFTGNTFFYNYLSLERYLIRDQQMILHSCYIIENNEAILFTAPSGTGKSTQGNLWNQFFHSEIINGDRSLLGKQDQDWTAFGIPFSGTSGISRNQAAKIKAIIYLHQGPENHAELMSPLQAFGKLFGQITINQWNTAFTESVCSMIEDLITSVPVYDYTCTKEKDAAEYLHHLLYS